MAFLSWATHGPRLNIDSAGHRCKHELPPTFQSAGAAGVFPGLGMMEAGTIQALELYNGFPPRR